MFSKITLFRVIKNKKNKNQVFIVKRVFLFPYLEEYETIIEKQLLNNVLAFEEKTHKHNSLFAYIKRTNYAKPF